MERMVQKFSIVYVGTSEKTEVFRSIEDMPEDLRQRLIRTGRTSEVNTLIIANEKGREFLETQGFSRVGQQASETPRVLPQWAKWVAVSLLLLSGAGVLVFLFQIR